MFIVVIAVVVAVFIGIRTERARQAHRDWYMYKARIAHMRGLRMRETLNAAIAVFALVAMLALLIGNGG